MRLCQQQLAGSRPGGRLTVLSHDRCAGPEESKQRNVPYIQRPRKLRGANLSGQPALEANVGARWNLYGRLPCGKQIFEVLTRRFIAVLYPAFALWIGCPIYCWP